MFNRFSAYGRPINVCLSQGFQLSPQYFIFRKGSIRVLIDNGLGYFTDILQKLSVAGYIRYFQIKSNAALLLPNHPAREVSNQLRLSRNHRSCVP